MSVGILEIQQSCSNHEQILINTVHVVIHEQILISGVGLTCIDESQFGKRDGFLVWFNI